MTLVSVVGWILFALTLWVLGLVHAKLRKLRDYTRKQRALPETQAGCLAYLASAPHGQDEQVMREHLAKLRAEEADLYSLTEDASRTTPFIENLATEAEARRILEHDNSTDIYTPHRRKVVAIDVSGLSTRELEKRVAELKRPVLPPPNIQYEASWAAPKAPKYLPGRPVLEVWGKAFQPSPPPPPKKTSRKR